MYTVVANNSININKTNIRLSTKVIEHKQKLQGTYQLSVNLLMDPFLPSTHP